MWESLYRVLNQPAVSAIVWMAYPGTGWIDKPLASNPVVVLEFGVSIYFWSTFCVISIFCLAKRIMFLRSKDKRSVRSESVLDH